VAVTVALWVVLIVPAVAVNVAEVPLAGTVTDAGTVSEALLSERATLDPPAGAALFRVTVQVVEAPEFTLVGLHAKLETKIGATRLNGALWEAPFKVAVTVAFWVVFTVPAVAVKVAEVPLAGTVMDAGTVSEALLSESATTDPPAGAA
jgi:hypothetical protein